ncbi:hypothetical protein TcWFU_002841 [Taenia crassiceps]|uniref:Uncharacterized protein n=1 Tax=Taenia crassiceps TaxID=6207 RepID=A0ABR4Q7Y0_9CEST
MFSELLVTSSLTHYDRETVFTARFIQLNSKGVPVQSAQVRLLNSAFTSPFITTATVKSCIRELNLSACQMER